MGEKQKGCSRVLHRMGPFRTGHVAARTATVSQTERRAPSTAL